ncbi:hypothetical protein SVAN01_06522 [Stagonosporopsis vannaccii]|nr:hypothetical protein SVAN01_06522 [Stagonosporopsis vannaccii]
MCQRKSPCSEQQRTAAVLHPGTVGASGTSDQSSEHGRTGPQGGSSGEDADGWVGGFDSPSNGEARNNRQTATAAASSRGAGCSDSANVGGVRALKVRRWWHRTRFGEDAAATLSCADAESERGLECSVRRGWRMVLGVEYGADRRCMAGGGSRVGCGPVPEFLNQRARSRGAGQGRAEGSARRAAARSERGGSSSQRREQALEQLRRVETTGSGHGVGEPKAAGEGGQRRAAARIVSLGGAKRAQRAGESEARRASRSSGGARQPSTKPGGQKQRQAGAGAGC